MSARWTASTPATKTTSTTSVPDECIDCAACEPVCPVTAIFAEDSVPAEWQDYIAKNYDYFKNTDPAEMKRK